MNRAVTRPLHAFATLVLAALTLGGCASAGGSYPSLALRDAERVHGQAEPVPAQAPEEPAPAAAPSPDLAGRLGQLVDQAQAAHGRFETLRPGVQARIASARGAAMGSDGWSVASIALAGLETARGQTLAALVEVDSLEIADRAARAGGQSPDSAPIAAARGRIEALVEAEDRVLSALSSSLGT